MQLEKLQAVPYEKSKEITISIPKLWSQFGLVSNVVGCISEVNQHRARLVLGWVTVYCMVMQSSTAHSNTFLYISFLTTNHNLKLMLHSHAT